MIMNLDSIVENHRAFPSAFWSNTAVIRESDKETQTQMLQTDVNSFQIKVNVIFVFRYKHKV